MQCRSTSCNCAPPFSRSHRRGAGWQSRRSRNSYSSPGGNSPLFLDCWATHQAVGGVLSWLGPEGARLAILGARSQEYAGRPQAELTVHGRAAADGPGDDLPMGGQSRRARDQAAPGGGPAHDDEVPRAVRSRVPRRHPRHRPPAVDPRRSRHRDGPRADRDDRPSSTARRPDDPSLASSPSSSARRPHGRSNPPRCGEGWVVVRYETPKRSAARSSKGSLGSDDFGGLGDVDRARELIEVPLEHHDPRLRRSRCVASTAIVSR